MPQPFVVQPRSPASVVVQREGVDGRRAPAPGVRRGPVQADPPEQASGADASAPGGPGAQRPRRPVPKKRAADLAPRHPMLAPIAEFLDDDDVTDLFINGSAGLFVDRGEGAEQVVAWRATDDEVRDLAVALIGLGGRHIDDATPCVDVRLAGGLRVHAVLPPVAAEGAAISIRVSRPARADLDELESLGMFDPATRKWLESIVARRQNILITGAAGAGKTTLLAALLARVPTTERIVTIEDVAELSIDHPHHVRLESRQPNLEGAGAIGLARLVREALRMRPDRIVVGECRGDEVRELLSALNTGHDGGAGTVHANGLDDVAARLEALGALAGLDDRALARQVTSAIHWVIHIGRDADGRRTLQGIGRPAIDERGRLRVVREPVVAMATRRSRSHARTSEGGP